MKNKKYLFGGVAVAVLVVGAITLGRYHAVGLGGSVYGLSAVKVQLPASSNPSRLTPAPLPPTQSACQSSGNIFASPVTGATYVAGSYLPVAWRTSLPSLPTHVALYLVPQSAGSQIPFSQYSTATGVTSNGTMSVSLTQGGDAAAIIPASVPAGQYYLEIQFTFTHGGSITCSGNFTITAPPVCASTFGYLSQWGSYGTGNGQFRAPRGVAVDPSGNVYVTDQYNSRVEKFSSNGTYLSQFGSPGIGNGQLFQPTDITVDSLGNLYVADDGNSRIEKFDSHGNYVAQWPIHPTGSQVNGASAIAISPNGDIYVTGSGGSGSGSGYTVNSSYVQEFTAAGLFVRQWGTRGTGNGEFLDPYGIAIDSAGDVYVSDYYLNRVLKFTSTGGYVAQWGSTGTANGQFKGPLGMKIDAAGNVYVADSSNNRIEKFSSAGSYLSQWGTAGTGNGQFDYPAGLGIDATGDIYVSDANLNGGANNRIEKFGVTACPLY